jgi:hypothetical protein
MTRGDGHGSVQGTAPGAGDEQIRVPETDTPGTESTSGLLTYLLSGVEGTRIFCGICYNNSVDQ